jgi:hypothetical protein
VSDEVHMWKIIQKETTKTLNGDKRSLWGEQRERERVVAVVVYIMCCQIYYTTVIIIWCAVLLFYKMWHHYKGITLSHALLFIIFLWLAE